MPDVVAAVIEKHGKILICRRPLEKRHGGLWEFPGGKVESNETFFQAVRRELHEELGVTVTHVGSILLSIHDPGSKFVINFIETEIEGSPTANEHISLEWVKPEQLLAYELATSDRAFGENLVKGTRI